MPPNRHQPRPSASVAASPTAGTERTAETNLKQLTWVVAGRTFSREFHPDAVDQLRAARLARLAAGARNVSTATIAAGTTYTAYGEH